MADLFGMDLTAFTHTSSVAGQFFMYLLYAALAGGVTWLCTYLLSFKIIIIQRQNTSNGYVLNFTKARQFRDKDGVLKWRFLNSMRFTHNPPASEFLSLTRKGKLIAECDKTMTGTITWRKVSLLPENPDEFTSEERLATIVEIRRAEERKKKSDLDKLLAVAPSILVVMILIIAFAFWGNVTDAATKANTAQSQANVKATEQLAQASTVLAAAIEGWNTGHGIVVGNQSYVGNVPPPTNVKVPN